MEQKFSFKHFGILLFAGVFLLLGSCKSSETAVNRVLDADVETLLNRLETEPYRINIRSISPFNTFATQRVLNQLLVPYTGNSANRIDVGGDGNYLEIKDSIASASLPFFGEQRQGGAYYRQGDSGINMASEPQDYTISPHKSKNAAVVSFTIDDSNRSSENYDVFMMIFPGGKSEISIMSSHRTPIYFSGILEFVEADNEE